MLEKESKPQTAPDPLNHLLLSLVKSAFRITGCIILIFNVPGGAAVLIVAEILGIVEELV